MISRIFFSCILFLLLTLNLSAQKFDFIEGFDDNSNFWNVNQNDSYIAKIEHSQYIINHIDSIGANLFWNHNVDIDYESDFLISTSYHQISGSELYGHGLVWGGLDGLNFFAFTISSHGVASIYKFEDGEYINILKPIDRKEFINGIGENNVLSIQKTGDQVFFLINGNLIHSRSYQQKFGNKIGYVLNTKMKISVDFLKIRNGSFENKVTIDQPEIKWITPSHELTSTNDDYVDVEVGILAHNHLNVVKFYVNGLEVSTTDYQQHPRGANFEEEEIYDEIISEHVKLKSGINYLKVILVDFDGHTVTSKRIVKSTYRSFQSNRHDYALLFASDEYDQWGDLSNPINDCDTIAQILDSQYGFKTELVRNASREDVLAKLYEYNVKEYGKYDQLLIIFAGHGKFDNMTGMGYIVCPESKKMDHGNSSYIGFPDLKTFVDHSNSQHVCMIMDVCFGGSFKEDNHQVMRGSLEDDPIYDDLSKGEYIHLKLENRTRKYITSGDHFVPDGVPGSHSPFARKVISGLGSQGGEDGILTYSELLHYLERVKTQPVYGSFDSNEEGSEFLFIAK